MFTFANLYLYYHIISSFVCQVFYTVWKRTNPEQVANIERQLDVLTPEEQTIEIIKESGATELAQRAIEKSSTVQSTTELSELSQEIKEEIKELPNVKEEVKDSLIDHFKSELQKDFGVRTEHKAIKHYENKEKEVVRDNNDKFYKLTLGTLDDDTKVLVGGRIDGLNDKGRVVEVKNRMKRFFNPLPKYDIAQESPRLYVLSCEIMISM